MVEAKKAPAAGPAIKGGAWMKKLIRDIREHWLLSSIFLIFWLAIWGISASTWITTPGKQGMHPLAMWLHLLVPFSAGALLGWWRKIPSQPMKGLRSSYVSGMVAMEINMAVLLVADLIEEWKSKLEPAAQQHVAVGEYVEWAIILGCVGLLLGLLGGLTSGLLALVAHRGRFYHH
jgi:hypothetical protein